MSLTAGSLCSGYGGLSMAVENFFGAETRWFSEFEKAPSKILEQHWPGVPNHGDMTAIDWAAVEPVDIIEGGTPCQDLSAAGRRRGMTEGTRSNLWVQMREAVATIRPSLVIWENVRGAYSARAASAVESEPGLLGGFGDGRPALRALGRVLGDFSELGYDTEWVGVRASDAGAPHARYRVFVVAYAAGIGWGEGWPESTRFQGRSDHAIGRAPVGLTLLPTPAAHESGNTPEQHLAKKPGRSVVTSLQVMADHGLIANGGRLLQTPVASEGTKATVAPFEDVSGSQEFLTNQIASVHRDGTWGPYAAAIARWETTLGRPAPAPTLPDGKGGKHRLNARLVEWLMGVPAGHVTDVPITRNEQLKALGNGVVPQQAELALSIAWSRIREGIT